MLTEKSSAIVYSACGVGCVLSWLDERGAAILVIVAVITAIFNICYKIKSYKLEKAKFKRLFAPKEIE